MLRVVTKGLEHVTSCNKGIGTCYKLQQRDWNMLRVATKGLEHVTSCNKGIGTCYKL
jgi:hypothetical protein